ncbi:MAG: right-handed parallel beta-helix repeat-containing protein [Saprospiraceae bacterium]|nr:right-handed parallel beta-helix repeat-containing protein [Saprospiraceae bacterium]
MRWIYLFCYTLMMATSMNAQPIWVVSNTQDSGEGSLRDAIEKAGMNMGADTIVFDLSFADPGYDSTTGVWSIESASEYVMPAGTVVYGANAYNSESIPQPGVEIHGMDSSILLRLTGLHLSDEVVLRGLLINRFQIGVWVQGSSVIIENCYLGADPSGSMSRANGNDGILLADGVTNANIHNCLISGNVGYGIRLSGRETRDNTISNNLIGTDATGNKSLPNGHGLHLHAGANNNLIVGNIIAGNTMAGISVFDTATNHNIFEENLIGVGRDEITEIPNGSFGVAFFNGPANNRFGPGNRVAFNGDDGVLVDGSDGTSTTGNVITFNSISNNGDKGIENFRGGNAELSPPTIDSISEDIVYGSAGPNQVIELFFDPNDEGCCHASTTMSGLTGGFTVPIPDHAPDMPFLTATATDTMGNTSEFSTPVCLGAPEVEIEGSLDFCAGLSTELNAGNHTSYLWSTGENTPSITVADIGMYSVTVTDSFGCTGSASVFVAMNELPSVNIEVSSYGCANTALSAGEFIEYQWSTGDTTALITAMSAGTYQVSVIDSNGCIGADSVAVQDDPLSLPWVQDLINNPFNPYCNECLTLSQAIWMDSAVIIFDWEASACNFTDIGFTTIYNCQGDTVQHCYLSIAGEQCDPDAMIGEDALMNREQLWQCTTATLPSCPSTSDAILLMPWLIDTLDHYEALCDAICIEGNAGNFLYKHMIDTNIILELQTTCGDIIRRFYDCQGSLIYSCSSFNFAGISDCDLPFLPVSGAGELIWECSTTSSRTDQSTEQPFKVYPTIISDRVTIETEGDKPWSVIMYDGFGRNLARKSSRARIQELDADSWPQGMIYAKLISSQKAQLVKLLKVE